MFTGVAFIYRIDCIFRTSTKSTTYETIYNRERVGPTSPTTFDCNSKSMEIWMEAIDVGFCIGYNVPTLFRYLQNTSLIYIKHETPETCYPPLWSTVKLYVLCICNINPQSQDNRAAFSQVAT